MHTYSYGKRQDKVSQDDQAEINAENLDNFVKDVHSIARAAKDYLDGHKELQKAIKDGDVAFVADEVPEHPFVFNRDLSKVSYGSQTLRLKTDTFEATMLRLLVQSAERSSNGWVSNEAVQNALDEDFPNYDGGFSGIIATTVKNARTRLNAKFEKAFEVKNAIVSRRSRFGEGGGGRSKFRVQCKHKK